MSITRISAADLYRTARDFTPDERAALDRLDNEQVEKAALADPDAQPSTPNMLRRGQIDRPDRLDSEGLEKLGVRLTEAEPTLNLPVWAVEDQNGQTVLIKAVALREAAPLADLTTKVLKLEAIQQVPRASERSTR